MSIVGGVPPVLASCTVMTSRDALFVVPNEPIGHVHPELHGGFAEHLGELVYPGLWVGEASKQANDGGIRRDVVEALRHLALPVLRWPGGNFADSYRWRDGIGPRASRPLRVNTQWGNAPETNHFGTHEFMALCRAVGAQPYFAANVGSETPAYARDWVEYCNFAGPSALASERAQNGSEQPFSVRYWGVGNENWGAGGNMGPEHYAAEYTRYRTYFHEYSGTRPFAIASGPNGADWEWTARFFRYLAKNHWQRMIHVDGFGLHFYVWNSAREALDIDRGNWYETITRASAMDGLIAGHRALMDEHDPERRVALLVDEWGCWHKTDPGKPSYSLYQQNTVRDAVVAAITLDIFNQRADMVRMANVAQVVNVLHSLLLADESRCVRTPTFHVFDLYRAHRGGTAVRCESAAEYLPEADEAGQKLRAHRRDGQPVRLRRVVGSASRKGDELTLTMVNTSYDEPALVALDVVGHALQEPKLVELRFSGLTDHNTFEEPERVGLAPPRALSSREHESLLLGPGAVVRLTAGLA